MKNRIALFIPFVLLSAACVMLNGTPLGTSTSTTFTDGSIVSVTTYRVPTQRCDSQSRRPCMALDWKKLDTDLQGKKATQESPFDLIGGR